MTTGAPPPARRTTLRIAAAVVVVSGRLLVLSRADDPHLFTLPGARLDQGEDPLDRLGGVMAKALSVRPTQPRLLAVVDALGKPPAPGARPPVIRMTVYEAGIDRQPEPADGVARVRWVRGNERDLTLAPAVRDEILPLLRRRGMLAF